VGRPKSWESTNQRPARPVPSSPSNRHRAMMIRATAMAEGTSLDSFKHGTKLCVQPPLAMSHTQYALTYSDVTVGATNCRTPEATLLSV
jgi:hypothetical protein